MKNLFTCLAALALAVAVIGCAKKNADGAAAVDDSVMDVSAAPIPPSEPEMTYAAPVDIAAPAPQAAQPVWAEPAPAPAVSETPVAASTGPGSYTVKKGDTLFSIAKQSYGSGKDWQRIVAANPGLSPSSLKAGKTIVIP